MTDIKKFPKKNTKNGWGFEGKETGRIVWQGYSTQEIDEWRVDTQKKLKEEKMRIVKGEISAWEVLLKIEKALKP